MELKKVENITDIKKGDTIIITGDSLVKETFKVQMVKISDSDGTEIIIDKKKNRYFNLNMYLENTSWVIECYIIK